MNLRNEIAKTIMRGIEKHEHESMQNYDPDAMHRIADEVVAMLMTKLTGHHWKAQFHPTLVGPANFTNDGELYE